MAAITAPNSQSLKFTQSESKPVGLGGGVRDYLRDNAVSVVGMMQMAGAGILLFERGPVVKAVGAAGLVSRGFMAAYGNKEHQQTFAEKHGSETPKLGAGVVDNIRKALHPRAYPLEFATAVSILANAASMGYGISLERSFAKSHMDKTLPRGRTLIGVGAASILSFSYLLFAKEKVPQKEDDKSLEFAHSNHKPQNWLGETAQTLKDQPVLTSSLINGAITGVMTVGNLMDGNKMLGLAGSIFFSSYVVKALFVQKEQFNINGARDTLDKEQEKPQDKILARGPRGPFVEQELNNAQPTEQAVR